VKCETAGYAPIPPREVPAGTEALEFTAIEGVVATVTVVDGHGEPVPRLRVEVLDARNDDVIRNGATNAEGDARLGGLDPGVRYHLIVYRETRPNHFVSVAVRLEWAPVDTLIRLGSK
jgi:hypothetical protein